MDRPRLQFVSQTLQEELPFVDHLLRQYRIREAQLINPVADGSLNTFAFTLVADEATMRGIFASDSSYRFFVTPSASGHGYHIDVTMTDIRGEQRMTWTILGVFICTLLVILVVVVFNHSGP